MKEAGRRAYIQALLARASLDLDTKRFPWSQRESEYQPMPWIGANALKRGAATYARWSGIARELPQEAVSLIDVGSCTGFFCFKFVEKYDGWALGIEKSHRFTRIAQATRELNPSLNGAFFWQRELTPQTIHSVPAAQISLVLSIWHHWVFNFGLEGATFMLTTLWDQTEVLFFESGQDEVADEFELPVRKGLDVWLPDYLQAVLSNGTLTRVGEFAAGEYEHYRESTNPRTLYKIER